MAESVLKRLPLHIAHAWAAIYDGKRQFEVRKLAPLNLIGLIYRRVRQRISAPILGKRRSENKMARKATKSQRCRKNIVKTWRLSGFACNNLHIV